MAYTTINKGSSYFNTVLYTGNGTSQSITGVGFQPDMVWGKIRDTNRKHNIYDVIRGVQQRIVPNDTAVEDTVPGVTAFNSDGFSVGLETDMNQNGNTFVGWSWKANGAGVSNTAGTISSTVSANTTSGFSIVSYTGNATSGATIGHGLGVVPKMIIIKIRSGVGGVQWVVYHVSTGNTQALYLNTTAAPTATSGFFNNTTPSSTVFTVGNDTATNSSGNPMIAYCFADVKGYSKFGSYTGNGNADGTFVYTGFKPAFVLWKVSSTVEGWYLVDNKRDTYNVSGNYLLPNTSAAESGANSILDLLSNGFKFRSSGGPWWNGSGDTYIYMAFAENPFVTSGGIPTTAR